VLLSSNRKKLLITITITITNKGKI